MTFKDLAIGEVFEFDHSRLPACSGIARGPWRKVSARKYEHIDQGYVWQVGTVKVKVVRL